MSAATRSKVIYLEETQHSSRFMGYAMIRPRLEVELEDVSAFFFLQ